MRRLAALLLLALGCGPQREAAPRVAVYGATPGGIAAALAAAEQGSDVVLVEPTPRIGGLMCSGLSHADFRTFEGLTGFYFRFARRVERHYGPGVDCFRGTHAEPKVNLAVLRAMIEEQPRVRLMTSAPLGSVEVDGGRIRSAAFGASRLEADVFVDASYEGDLLAASGAPYRIGREGRSEFGESLAPERADTQLQGYNFRLVLTRAASRLPAPRPQGYRREDFLDVLPFFESGRLKSVFGPGVGAVYKLQTPPLPNGKVDVNDVSQGLVRLSLPPLNAGWPEAGPAERRRIFDEHLRHNVGLLHFLQTDGAVPARLREEANAWGFCPDEFEDTGHVSPQLYVREGRRLRGAYVFTERDVDPVPGDARSAFQPDAVALGDYGPNCHGTSHEGPRIGGRHGGEFYKPAPPYSIPYGVMHARGFPNLLVPVAASSSHVGFCALRLEPVWCSLGEAAGVAAHLAAAGSLPVQDVAPAEIRRRLHAAGAATTYVSDVLPGHPDFVAVQAFAARGGLHGLEPARAKPGERGRPIVGQYYEAFPGHAAGLDLPLDDATRRRWSAPVSARTRGDVVRSFRE